MLSVTSLNFVHRKMIGKYRSLNPYWHHVGLFYDQVWLLII